MSRRIDVELTSRRDDGSWTWRAAGARAPKGVVEEGMLPAGASVGDVLRVEVESFVDGITISAVLPPRSARAEPERIQLLDRSPDQLVTTTLAPRGRGERRPRRDDRGDRDRGERRSRGPREGGERRSARPAAEAKPRPKRLRPQRTYRRELVASLPEEQRPIAEELMRGGVPGVRAALDQQNEQARNEGKPEINPEPLLALAEDLWPRMRTAEWRDRAEAALAEVEELDLRDLRSVVVAADSAARDDETRAMATQLREALNRRVDEEHTKWLTELAELVAEGRVVAALRRSSRPPKAGSPLPSDLARLLVESTNEALNAEIGVDRWSVLLDALSYSPVRSSVEPAGVPESPSDELLAVVRKVASRLPAIAARFGVEAAPPPAPGRGGRRGRGRPDRGGPDQARGGQRGGGEGAAIPPPPSLTSSPADAEAPTTGDAPAGAAREEAAPAAAEQAEAAAAPPEPAPAGPAAADPAEAAPAEPAAADQAEQADAPAETAPAEAPAGSEQADAPAESDTVEEGQAAEGQGAADATAEAPEPAEGAADGGGSREDEPANAEA